MSPEAPPSTRRAWSRRGVAAAVVVLLAVVAAAVLLSHRSSTPRGSGKGTATTGSGPGRPVVAPLTGLADPSGVTAHRCAVTVKVGNTTEGRPQHGVDQADVVYEEVAEGGITRLAAVFQSQSPGRVGSVRSVRPGDQSVVWPLRGVFAYSGGNPIELASIVTAPVTRLDETRAGAMMFRDPTRPAPHNLYARVDQMYRRCSDPPPRPLFSYRASGVAASGKAAASVGVGFVSGYAVTWRWDAGSGRWLRSIFGAPDVGASRRQLSASNVVVMKVRYTGGVGSPDAEPVLTGTGALRVFTAGKLVEGTWVRHELSKPAELLDAQHRPIRLTPGQTWVELPDVSYAVSVSG